MNSFQGYFLVAAPHQLDPNFVKSVVLVVEHTEQGAFGVIVNEACRDAGRFRLGAVAGRLSGKANLCFGGPVTGPLMAVHMNAYLGERQFLPGLYFSGKERNVLKLMRRAERPCKIFMGYVGWGPQQLDWEIEQGVWRPAPAMTDRIFSEDDDLWEQLARQISCRQMRIMFNIGYVPDNPLLN
jgi:putative transcriptional regulator